MKSFSVDLHTHSTASDGTCSPSDLMQLAKREGVSVCALTDHDTLDGLKEAQLAARSLGMTFVRGCEISTKCCLGSVHILGLWLPREKARLAELKNVLEGERRNRMQRNLAMIEKLNALGIAVSYAELEALACNAVIGRPHFAQVLVQKGVVTNYQEAFRLYLGKLGAAYVERTQMLPQQAVDILKRCGALVSMAHPGLITCSHEDLEKLTTSLKEHGLDAMEVYHSSHGAREVSCLHDLAKRLGLAVTGGSDFHGARKPHIRLGHVQYGNEGDNRLSRTVYDALMQYRRTRRSRNDCER